MTARRTPPRPGRRATEATPDDIAAMIRVDHAGEYGAVRIYEGQLAVLGASPATARSAALVRHMAAQEDAHLATFDRLIAERGVRPTVLAPVWDAAGFALGAVTALMGETAAMACTEAVEEVIDAHYAAQEEKLKGRDAELEDVVTRFRAEEIEHRDTARAEGAKEAPAYPVLTGFVKAGVRLAIRLSEKV
ncbi:3-demethoxyubiquinol 3-hydroxylase [Alphaproteobacteria bacterium SO-S41]|nr:3-demethoxyubiquinol 3-hydroxylase [Alphaproteobacteria bacterium SO-S41]